jgi:hypothetical protein
MDMTSLRPLAFLALIAGLLLNPVFGAGEPKEITWDDLVPAEAQFDDPFTKLDDDQLYQLGLVAEVRDALANDGNMDEETMALYRLYVETLEEAGIDIDGLIKIREQVVQERIAKTYMANRELEGKTVRIPGFLLPLEFDNDRVTEFFLVPYVGACIHTPPPPPNQIVYVRTEQGYTPEGGLYAPVWVNGLLKNERSESSLNYIDGSSNIPSSYSLNATTVEPYE